MTMMGIQRRFDIPCIKAVVVKKYATLATLVKNVGWGGGVPKKSIVISTIATVGPAARKLQKKTAAHTIPAM